MMTSQYWSGKKPLPEPILSQIYVAIWRHYATMGQLTHWIRDLMAAFLQMIFSKTFLMNIMASHITSNLNIQKFGQSDINENSKTRVSGPL